MNVMAPKATYLRAAALGVGACAAVAAGAWAWRRYGPPTYARYRTMFGRARVYEVADDDGEPVRLLEVGGIVQSGCYLGERYADLVFEYLKRYDALFDYRPAAQRICVLGCGGYDYPKHLVAHHSPVVVDAVEIDPAITAIARRHFFLERVIEEFDTDQTGRLNLICADALDHLRGDGPLYDAIVNDAFDAGTPPAHLTTPAFARAVHGRLVPGGVYLSNIVSALEGPGSEFLRGQIALYEREFDAAEVVPCDPESLDEQDNVILIARKAG